MKFLTWNVRGCNVLDKHCMIKRGFDQAKPEVIYIQETKLGSEEAARILGVRQRWSGFFVNAKGASGGLGILWNPQLVKVEAVSSSKYWQLAKVRSQTINFSSFLITVYGPIKTTDKCQLWKEITNTLEDIRPAITIFVGDFNATLSHLDKHGGRLGFSNIAEKLDRFFLVGDWNLVPLIFEADVLAISGSDHFPVSLVLQKDGAPLRCPFKVEKMWLREKGFRDQVVRWWKEAPVVEGFLSFQFFKKLSYVKQKLKSWNKTVFGNIFEEK
ncbi:uncharacterized protein LOC131051639 [Cryptomeria japonica]|uniref:uncharacterized protein LOC131051639 n=1 Tax=Cryptomeria japonica TaxID=3369 RepID=UPI0027DA7D7D|nr:uncharacterized protein LOC131051639 [Cryptomeria japonica]